MKISDPETWVHDKIGATCIMLLGIYIYIYMVIEGETIQLISDIARFF
jgi:hypothetical protein